MTDYAAYIWSDPSSAHPGPTVSITAHGIDRTTWAPADPIYQDRLTYLYDDADVIDAAKRSLNTAGWELTSHWTADDIGWRADATQAPDTENPPRATDESHPSTPVTDADVRALTLHDPDEEWQFRSEFSPAATRLADTLRSVALGTAEGSEFACGHGSTYTLPTGLPIPSWLHGLRLEPPEGPWPEFGRTEYPVDWPEVLATNPEQLTWNHAMLECNFGASAASISTAYRLLAARGCHPYMDVCLWLDPDARIAVEPIGLFADPGAVDDGLMGQVDEILVSGGRPRELLRDDEGPGYWLLEA